VTERWPRPLFEPETAAVGSLVALVTSRCTACGRHEFPSRERCPACRSATTAALLSTTASVAGYTSVSHPPPGAAVDVPYAVVIAAFPEGVSVLGRVVGAGYPELARGTKVDTVAAEVGDDLGYAYRLVAAADQ
jgi:uncharacterized OB-fold protein